MAELVKPKRGHRHKKERAPVPSSFNSKSKQSVAQEENKTLIKHVLESNSSTSDTVNCIAHTSDRKDLHDDHVIAVDDLHKIETDGKMVTYHTTSISGEHLNTLDLEVDPAVSPDVSVDAMTLDTTEAAAAAAEEVLFDDDADVIVGPYQLLLDDVHLCLEDEYVPSAPPAVVEIHSSPIIQAVIETPVLTYSKKPCTQQMTEMKDLFDNFNLENDLEQSSVPLSDNEYNDLYCNSELVDHLNYVTWISEPDHLLVPMPIIELLKEYISLNEKLMRLEKQLPEANKSVADNIKNIWTVWPNMEITERYMCRDKKVVIFTQRYQQARFNPDIHDLFRISLAEVRDLAFQDLIPTSIQLQLCTLKIEKLLIDMENIHVFKTALKDGRSASGPEAGQYLSYLCHTIGVLFCFEKRIWQEFGEKLVGVIRDWIKRLLRLAVLVGTLNEKFFIAYQLMYSSPGVCEWAGRFVQCPPSLQCVHSFLHLLLHPTSSSWRKTDSDESWVLVDSDGESLETGLTLLSETDLSIMLDQIPMKDIFTTLAYDSLHSEYSILKLLAFSAQLVNTIESGLQNYREDRFRQFGKRLGKSICQLMQLVNDIIDFFCTTNTFSQRMQVEYDSFIIKAARALHNTQFAWQFLAAAPFDLCSPSAKWQVCLILQLWNEPTVDLSVFGEKFSSVPHPEQFYLLSTLCNIALSKDAPQKLIRCVTLEIFYVGFLDKLTKETTYKAAKDLLFAIFNKHGYLLSELLDVQDKYFDSEETEDQSLTHFLWADLALEKWQTSLDDVAILKKWLLSPFASVCNSLARTILKLLCYENIQWNVQLEISLSLASAASRHCFESTFCDWAWQRLTQLRLHVLDRLPTLSSLSQELIKVPDLNAFADLSAQANNNEAIACFIAVSSTNVGHSVPLIYSSGFKLVRAILTAKRYEAAFLCIEHMTVMFWDCQESLLSCESFISLLSEIVVLDTGYGAKARNIISNEVAGPIVSKFGMMLHRTLGRAIATDLTKTLKLWACLLTKLPLWHHCTGVLHLLDILCQYALHHSVLYSDFLLIIENQLKLVAPDESKSPLSSIINWIGAASPIPTVLPKCGCANYPYFSFAAILVEFEVFERKTTLWDCLLQELWNCLEKKTSVDSALKKVCQCLNLPVRGYSSLAFYRLTTLILETSVTHFLCEYLWVKLMELYLMRVPGLLDKGSVGACFFQGTFNLSIKKRLQAHLLQTLEAQPHNGSKFKAFSLWLSEPLILQPRVLALSLPLDYDPLLFDLILRGEDAFPLLSLVDKLFGQEQMCWTKMLSRNTRASPEPITKVFDTPEIRIKKRLEEFGVPLPIPVESDVTLSYILRNQKKLEKLDPPRFDEAILYFQKLGVYAKKAQKGRSRLMTLEKNLADVSPQLYLSTINRIKQKKPCDGVKVDNRWIGCSGAAVIDLKFESWALSSDQKRRFDDFLLSFQQKVSSSLAADHSHIVDDFFLLDNIVTLICKETLYNNQFHGTNLFYCVIDAWDSAIDECKEVRALLIYSLKRLGETCIAGNSLEMPRLLTALVKTPSFEPLYYLFTPNLIFNGFFVSMYKKAVASANILLLRKFNVGGWLLDYQPKVILRCDLLAVIMEGLQFSGVDLDETRQEVDDVLNEHLSEIVRFRFPDHYGEVLEWLLRCSRDRKISAATWYSFLNALAPADLHLAHGKNGAGTKSAITFLKKFAVEQGNLCASDLRDTASFLGKIIEEDRRSKKDRSMYDVYGSSSKPLLVLHGMVVLGQLVQELLGSPGSLSCDVIDKVWPSFTRLFVPWLAPYKNGTVLIQPFESDDAKIVEFCCAIFSEIIRYVCSSLVAGEIVLSHIWRFYAAYFCMPGVNDFVLSTIHVNLATLPWSQFHPVLQDVEQMLKVVNEFLPQCHNFLGMIFVAVDWNKVVQRSLSLYGSEINSHLHSYILHLMLKMPMEPSLKQNKTVIHHIDNALGFSWHLLDDNSYRQVIDWFCCSCDPSIVIDDPSSSYRELDDRILKLLQVAAGYHSSSKFFHPSTPSKRRLFVAATVKCLAAAESKIKQGLPHSLIKSFIHRQLNDIQTIVTATVPVESRLECASMLLIEVTKLFGEGSLSCAVEESIIEWLTLNDSRLVVDGLLNVAGLHIKRPVIYGAIVEACIENIFTVGGVRDWWSFIYNITPYESGSLNVDQVLMSNSYFLTLYALILRRVGPQKSGPFAKSEIASLLQLFTTVKPSAESEPKLILLIDLALSLCETDDKAIMQFEALCTSLAVLSSDRSSGLLSTLGLRKASVPTIKFKLCCLVAAAGVSILLEKIYSHQSGDKSIDVLEKASSNKQFLPVIASVLTARSTLREITSVGQLLQLLHSFSAQFYNKPYF